MIDENENTETVQEEVKDANEAESSTAKPEVIEPSANGAAKPESQPTPEPWHKSPQWKKLNERNRSLEASLNEIKNSHTKLLEQMALQGRMMNSQPGDNLAPEVLEDARKLARILKHPEIAKELGLGGNESLQQEIQRIQSERAQDSFNREFEQSLNKYVETYGLDKEELEQEVLDFIRSNEYFDKAYKPGIADMAFRHVLFPRLSELQERKVNLGLIKDKQIKKSGTTEEPSKGLKSSAKKLPTKLGDHLQSLINEGGGDISFD